MREQDIPWRQFQHWLFRSLGNEGCRLGQRQPPVLRLSPGITANIAVVSLCKRHTNISRSCPVPIGGLGSRAIPRSKGKLPRASPSGQSPEVVILFSCQLGLIRAGLAVPFLASASPIFRDSIYGSGATCVLAELSSILCANCPSWQEFSSQAYRLRYIDEWRQRQRMENRSVSDGEMRR